ncbi:uncharacterized protein N7511_002117 [Penicillium nucicola]|uniref:uncharacterized protein n=1 Tax=Penicillium nucicola TaxID=1850975 RepID=UPI002544D6CD|nr:uncharacterized protein N7511_002117 [Penicillium nucicola]KAJ5770066.1 hypothetical protein N7511_002117 [Penicillium nucicola]
MARLNTTNPLVNKALSRETQPKASPNTSPKKSTRRQSPSPTSDIFDDILSASASGANTSRPASPNKLPIRTKSLQKRNVAGAGAFDILPDSNSICPSETENRDSPGMKKKPRALGLSRVNSLLLSRPARPAQTRQRPSIKSDIDDDKENDVSDEIVNELPLFNGSPPRQSAIQSPARSRTSHTSVRDSVIAAQHEEDRSEGDSFDSLDDFIVSDDNEVSYHGNSENEDSETEPEIIMPPSPQRSPRKRLMRGRRPTPPRETILEEILQVEEKPTSPKYNVSRPQKKESRKEIVRAISSPEPESESSITRAVAPEYRDEQSSSSQFCIGNATDIINSLRELELDSEDEFSSPAARIESSSSPEAPLQLPVRNPLRFLVNRSVTPVEKSPITPMVKSTPRKGADKPPSKTALKKAEAAERRQAKDEKKAFDQIKESYAETFIRILDETVANGEVARMTQSTGGIKIKWNNLLQSTAGRAMHHIASPRSPGSNPEFSASIELNPKVLDSVDRILCTATHEYCHLANGLISRQGGHGPSFHAWGARCVDAMADHQDYGGGRIKVTTKHSYEIDYKYSWECQGCQRKFGRSSKSIDPERQRCPCMGLLVQVKPKPRVKKVGKTDDKENEKPTV